MYASAGLSGVRHLVVRGATRSDRGLVTRGRDRAAAAARERSQGSNGEELVVARVDIVMPQMGESIAEGTLSKWLKKVGDAVKRDEPIFEISTDKVDAEIPASVAGTLAEILVTEGQTVAVSTVVARLETDVGAKVAAPTAAPASAKPAAAKPEPAKAAVPTGLSAAAETSTPVPASRPEAARPSVASAGNGNSFEERVRTKSSPLVRKIAAEHGVEIA